MELATIAKPYAKGAFASAGGSATFAEWSVVLQTLAGLSNDMQLIDLMRSPQLKKARKIELINTMLSKVSTLSKEQESFVTLIIDNDRFTVLPTIASVFDKLVSDNEQVRRFDVISAYPLNDEQKTLLNKTLADTFSSQVSLTINVQPNLVGGVVIKHGDIVINASIEAQLAALSAQLS